jgi:hypothetical protein
VRKQGRSVFFRAFLACAALASAGQSAFPAESPSLEDRAAALAAFGSRAEGSPGEAAAFGYIEASLRGMGLEPEISGFPDAEEAYSSSSIVEAYIGGIRKDELAIVVPVGSWAEDPEPSDGVYGIALALDEAQELVAQKRSLSPCPLSIRFVFLGAEKRGGYDASANDQRVASLGSKTWIARQGGRSRLAVLYLNLPKAPSRVSLQSAGAGVLSPYWYYAAARLAAENSLIDYRIDVNRLQAYRLGLASDFGPAAPYLEGGIPAMELRGESPPGASPASPAWFGSFARRFALECREGFPDSWDKHYFIFQLGRLAAVFREKTYVAYLVALVALVVSSFLAITIAKRDAAKRILKRAPRILGEILALFVVLILVILAGKGIAYAESAILGSREAWQLSPRAFGLARLGTSFLLFLAGLSLLVEKRIVTPNPYFYEFAALLVLFLDVLIFSAADVSASFYFMWALILVELSLVARKRYLTLAAYILMYLPLIIIAGELVARPDLAAYAKLLSPGILDLLGLAALSFPFFVFTASPVLFFARRGLRARKRAIISCLVAAAALEVACLALSAIASPLAGPGRRDLSMAETVDQDKGSFEIEISGKRRIGGGKLLRGSQELSYGSISDVAEIAGEDGEKRIRISSSSSPFLDRADEKVAIAFDRPPYSVDISLESDAEMLLYDCSLPYKLAVDGKSATIYSAVNPGAELDFTLTVSSSFRSRILVEARYLSSPEDYALSSGAKLRDLGCLVKASGKLGGRAP